MIRHGTAEWIKWMVLYSWNANLSRKLSVSLIFADGDYCLGWGIPPYFVLTVHLHGAPWHKVWIPAAALLLWRMVFCTKQGLCCSFTLKLSLTKSVTYLGTFWIYKQEKENTCEQSGTLTLFKISSVFSGVCVNSFCWWISFFHIYSF